MLDHLGTIIIIISFPSYCTVVSGWEESLRGFIQYKLSLLPKKREELSTALRLKAKGTDSKAPGCREVGESGLLDSR